MAVIADLFARVGADTSEFDRKMKGVQGGLKGMSNVATRVGKIAAVGLGIGAAALGKLGADSLSMAADFESALAILSTAVDTSVTDIETLSEVALKMGADTELVGISASDAVDAMTILAKAGLSTAEIFGGKNGLNDFLADNASLSGAVRAAADLQAASELDLAESAELVAIAMKTFNLSSEDAVSIGDSFVKAADASVASVRGLADALKNVGPTAAAFGFSLDETNTALALFSTRGIQGGEAGTLLRSMMQNMLRPTKDVTGTLDSLGVSLFDAEGNMHDMRTIIGDLQASMSGMTQEQKLSTATTLAGFRGQQGLLTLLAEGVDGWDSMTQAMEDAATAQEIARIRTETYQGKMEAFEGVVESLWIRIGNELLPVMTSLAIKFAEFVEKHGDKLIDVFRGIVSAVKRIPEILSPVISIFGKFIDLIRDNSEVVIGAIKGIGAAFAVAAIADKVMGIVKILGLLTSPIGIIIAAAALLGIAWEENWGGIREIVAGVWETLGPIFESIVAWLQINIPLAIQFLMELWANIGPTIGAIWEGIVTAIEAAIGFIQALWENVLKPIIDSIQIDWELVGVAIAIVWESITTVIQFALDIIAAIFETFSALLSGDWDGFWEGIKKQVEIIWKFITDLWNGFWAGLVIVIDAFRDTIETAWTNFWTGMASAVMGILGPIVSFIQGIIDGIKEALGLADQFALSDSMAAAVNQAGAVNAADQAERGKANASGIKNFIVPAIPGRSGDAFGMRFRAGERVTVDTPGNAGQGGGNAELVSAINQLRHAISQQPRQIRDAVKLGMA